MPGMLAPPPAGPGPGTAAGRPRGAGRGPRAAAPPLRAPLLGMPLAAGELACTVLFHALHAGDLAEAAQVWVEDGAVYGVDPETGAVRARGWRDFHRGFGVYPPSWRLKRFDAVDALHVLSPNTLLAKVAVCLPCGEKLSPHHVPEGTSQDDRGEWYAGYLALERDPGTGMWKARAFVYDTFPVQEGPRGPDYAARSFPDLGAAPAAGRDRGDPVVADVARAPLALARSVRLRDAGLLATACHPAALGAQTALAGLVEVAEDGGFRFLEEPTGDAAAEEVALQVTAVDRAGPRVACATVLDRGPDGGSDRPQLPDRHLLLRLADGWKVVVLH